MKNIVKSDTQSYVVSASLQTHIGLVRETNEDSCCLVQPTDRSVLDEKGVLTVIADGMGGCQAGEVASRLAVETVRRVYYSADAEPQVALVAAFHEANRGIYDLSRRRVELGGMGTTCTALVLHRRVAYSAHVGDTRLYLVRSESIYQMTEDHSVVKEMVKQGAITLQEARLRHDRNLLLRAMGSHAAVEVATWEKPLPVAAGDCFVLSSDGLHDGVTDEELRIAAGRAHAESACNSLIATALERGGRDNITVAVVRIGS